MSSKSNPESSFAPFGALENPITIGHALIGDGSLSLIAGPCAIESESLCMSVAESLVRICEELGIFYIFKASFDKANRTSLSSFRGNGLEDGLATLQRIKNDFNIPVLTDVHETEHVPLVASVVDVLQIPAFLCRQTDLLVACGKYGNSVNIKKGQFLHAGDMKYAIEKVVDSGTKNVMSSERGAMFGYRDLIVDMRNLVIMRNIGYPVVFDATHSVQQMGGAGGSSGGLTQFIPAQARAAVAVGVDALFVETHPNPTEALSDGSNMLPLAKMREFLQMTLAIHQTHQQENLQ
ncbi:MAG: 3-deoxy-8-phosphooctulonate synthase [Chloroflexi bacterium]|nr:3-deoxy-8-phosphooctulonate synthase [Chloroflexota bacterium]|tara:strand:+ start:3103 stop:3981 length:879 start_codon:yes stop_codon:yes gene_type:complete